MNTVLLANWIMWALSALLLGIALLSYRESILYATRQRLYEIRDQALLAYVDSGWGPSSVGHTILRETLHAMIRHTHRVGLPLAIAAGISEARSQKRGFRVVPTPMLDLLDQMADGTEKDYLQETYARACKVVAVGLLARWLPVLWPFYVLLVVVGVAVGAWRKWQDALAARWQRVGSYLIAMGVR